MNAKTIDDTRLNQALALLDDARCLLADVRDFLPLGTVSHKLFQSQQHVNTAILSVQSVMPCSYVVPDGVA